MKQSYTANSKAHIKAAEYFVDNPPQKELTATVPANSILIIELLFVEEKEIDKLVKTVVG